MKSLVGDEGWADLGVAASRRLQRRETAAGPERPIVSTRKMSDESGCVSWI